MTYCHIIFTKRKKDNKEDEKKEGKKMIQFMVNTPMLTNWVPI
jgi:hypothetical protein